MQKILDWAMELLDGANPSVLDRVAGTKRGTRERAIQMLTSPLDGNSEIDIAILQMIPLEFMARGDLIWALWYIETVGKNWNTIPWEVLEQVYTGSISDREKCLDGDEETAKVLTSSLDAMFRMAKTHLSYKDDPRLYLLMGEYEEAKGKPYNAIAYYDMVIEDGSIDGYIASAHAYESLGRYDGSIMVLEAGWLVHNNLGLLGRLISTLCKAGRIHDALERYDELKSVSDEVVVPFLIYKGTIETDSELEMFEKIVAQYYTEATFVPLESLHALATSWSRYIATSFHQEDEKLTTLHSNATNWTEELGEEYTIAIQRRLWLMQTDILTLWDHRYIDYYVADLKKLWIEWDSLAKEILQDFFSEHFSEEVAHKVKMRDCRDGDLKSTDEANDQGSLLENISLHVSRIGELFFQWSLYDIQRGEIIPILRESARIEGDYDERMGSELSEALGILKNQSDYYDSLRKDVRENYESLIREFDEKYGIFYRRHIQCLAINSDIPSEQYPEILTEHADIAFLFWVEKCIAWVMPTGDSEEIEEIVQKYSLDKASILNALLFWTLIYDVSMEYAVGYLADYPHMLDVPQAIYVITEGLRSMDEKTRKIAIKDLHDLTKEAYEASGFFGHIRYVFGDINKNNPTKEDIEYMLLASGNVSILQKKEKVQSILSFQTASQYGSLEWLLQAGDSYENMQEYDKALEYFEKAFCQDDNITVIAKILHCTIRAANYDKAREYMDYAIKKEYDIWNYIVAFHLWQWNIGPALLQIIAMIRSKSEILDVPQWLLKLLTDVLSFVLTTKDGGLWEEEDELKIFASFVLSNIVINYTLPTSENFLIHWHYVNSLCNSYDGDALHERITAAIEPMVWMVDLDTSDTSSSIRSLELLQVHARNIYTTLTSLMEVAQNKKDVENANKISIAINEFCSTTILLLQRFPNSDRYVMWWRNMLKLSPIDRDIHDMPQMIQ